MDATSQLIRPNRPWMPRRRASQTVLAAAVLALIVSPAWANPGTAMLWPVVYHFFVGNLFIGIAEWIGLCFFGASKWRAALMIPANYFSAYFGIMFSRLVIPEAMLAGSGVLSNIVIASLVAIVAFTIIGIFLELPFAAISFRSPRKWKRVLLACVVVNTVTSAGLAWYYHAKSDLSLARTFRVVPLDEMRTLDNAWIHAITPDDLAVERFRLDGTGRALVVELPTVPPRLFYAYIGWSLSAADMDGDGQPDLIYHENGANYPIKPAAESDQAHTETVSDDEPIGRRWKKSEDGSSYTLIVTSIGAAAATQQPDPNPRRWMRLAADLRPEHERDPLVTEGIMDLQLRFMDGRTEELTMLSPVIETSATPKAITTLPGGLLVLELGLPDSPRSRGIFLADLHNRTIAYIGPWRSPVVVLDAAPAE